MIGMNEELAARHAAGNPVRIGLIGAGQMGVDIVAQVAMMKGIDIVVVADIDKARAKAAYATGLAERRYRRGEGTPQAQTKRSPAARGSSRTTSAW